MFRHAAASSGRRVASSQGTYTQAAHRRAAARLMPQQRQRASAVALAQQPQQRQQQRSMSTRAKLSESFLDGQSAEYVEAMYQAWQKNPASVHTAWDAYFRGVDSGAAPGSAYMSPPTLRGGAAAGSAQGIDVGQLAALVANLGAGAGAGAGVTASGDAMALVNLQRLVQAYRTHGHMFASLDPLGLAQKRDDAVLNPLTYGFTEADLDKEFSVGNGIYSSRNEKLKLRDLVDKLRTAYAGTVGMEFEHIDSEEQKVWLREQFEASVKTPLSDAERIQCFDRLAWADLFEKFLKKKFGQDKRFGLDGGEMLIPLMKSLIDESANRGVENVVMGMPHRGRLSVLANVLRKPLKAILKEFEKPDALDKKARKSDFSFHSGDVKYHLGTSCDRPTNEGKIVHLSLLANPSHLEAVDPLVEGKTRAKQDMAGDLEHKKSMSIQLHGDAAFAGQGVVYETLLLSGLDYYTTGGTVHIIVNNQIGFTTNPHRSSRGKCTDVAKSAELPVFHVNGDDPDACVRVAHLAAKWRAKFGKDAIIDLVCYRRHGHNELDEPKFTQPKMYDTIANHPDTFSMYSQKLIEEGTMTEQQVQQSVDRINSILEQAFVESKTHTDEPGAWLESKWKGFHSPAQFARIKNTGVPIGSLLQVGEAIANIPGHFNPHPAIKRDFKRKHEAILEAAKEDPTRELIDWGTAEALAFGSLLLEGNTVRLSGQDVERGTFSHRHAVITDQVTGEYYTPLNNIAQGQAKFHVCNSPLSEFGVLGFETGYALENPNALVLWEAQFGDFANGAQIIIDQFISCGEAKWRRQCGLTMLLPHGYDGQGPEHSSARLERFLQMCDGDEDEWPFDESSPLANKPVAVQMSNMQVLNCTTPASYFHALRRQVHRTFRKPCVIMSPKKLLRHPRCKSGIDEFDDVGEDTRFERVIGEQDEKVRNSKVRKVVLCSGQVYYDLLQEREDKKITDVALVRLEQLAPFPWMQVKQHVFDQFGSDCEFVWAQEEPKNMGAWTWTRPRIDKMLEPYNKRVKYVGRAPAASPATGLSAVHKMELYDILSSTFE